MQYAKFKKVDSSIYFKEYSDDNMGILGSFFGSDITCAAQSWIEWINDSSSISMNGNYCFVQKLDGYILLEFMYDDEKPLKHMLAIKENELLKLLEKWGELYEEKPNEIIITYDDNEKFSIEGKN